MYSFKRLIDKKTRCFCDYIVIIDRDNDIIIYYAVYDLKKPLIRIQDENKMILINNPDNEDDPCKNRIGTLVKENSNKRFIRNHEYTGIINLDNDIFYNKRF